MEGRIKHLISYGFNSGLATLLIQTKEGIEQIHGDWRPLSWIIEDLGIGAKVEIIERDNQKFIKPIGD